jgi:hypothetical protein
MKKIRCLNGTQIKIIMVIFMVCDHIHQMFLSQGAPQWLTMVGRLVLPAFLFLVIEGWEHTRNQRKYMLRLLYGSLAVSILSAVITGFFPNNNVVLMNNIFSTFLVTCWYLWCIDRLKARKIVSGLLLMLVPLLTALPMIALGQLANKGGMSPEGIHALALISSALPNILGIEGGAGVVFLGVILYLLHGRQMLQGLTVAAFGAVLFVLSPHDIQWMMAFAAVPIFLYNGERGRGMKYFFYVFYPAHLYVLYLLAYFMK